MPFFLRTSKLWFWIARVCPLILRAVSRVTRCDMTSVFVNMHQVLYVAQWWHSTPHSMPFYCHMVSLPGTLPHLACLKDLHVTIFHGNLSSESVSVHAKPEPYIKLSYHCPFTENVWSKKQIYFCLIHQFWWLKYIPNSLWNSL